MRRRATLLHISTPAVVRLALRKNPSISFANVLVKRSTRQAACRIQVMVQNFCYSPAIVGRSADPTLCLFAIAVNHKNYGRNATPYREVR